MHPFDAEGKRCGHEDLPKTVVDMVDDPFRALAGESFGMLVTPWCMNLALLDLPDAPPRPASRRRERGRRYARKCAFPGA